MNTGVTSTIRSILTRSKAFWLTAAVVLVMDQTARGIAQIALKPEGWQETDPQPVYPFIDGLIHGTWATGRVLGHMNGPALGIAVVLVASFWLAVFYFVVFRSQPRQWLLRVAGGLVLGGLLSNLIDLALFGSVRNFLLLGFDNPFSAVGSAHSDNDFYSARPNFSTAAVASFAGMILVVVGSLIGKERKPAAK